MSSGRRHGLLLVAMGVLVALAFVASLALGSVRIPFADVLAVLFGGGTDNDAWTAIVLNFRLPKSLTALVAGAALAVSGLQMQALFRNALAGPYVLGINAGASLGVALVIMGSGQAFYGASDLPLGAEVSLIGAAILGAGGVMGLVLLLSRSVQDSVSLLLLGLMFGYAAGALVNVLAFFSDAERLQSFMLWSFGSFGGVTREQLRIFMPVMGIGLVLAGVGVKAMNALLLGEQYAGSMGLSVRRARALIIVSSSLLAGGVTAFCGPVAFLGLAVPHVCRGVLATADQRLLLPATILVGALLALLADIVAQGPGHGNVLPLNSVTAFIGAPIVVWVILRRRQMKALT